MLWTEIASLRCWWHSHCPQVSEATNVTQRTEYMKFPVSCNNPKQSPIPCFLISVEDPSVQDNRLFELDFYHFLCIKKKHFCRNLSRLTTIFLWISSVPYDLILLLDLLHRKTNYDATICVLFPPLCMHQTEAEVES